jgi:hypothetical protein
MVMGWCDCEIGVRRQVPDAAWLGIARLLCHLRLHTTPWDPGPAFCRSTRHTFAAKHHTLQHQHFPTRLPRLLGMALRGITVSKRQFQQRLPSRDSPDQDIRTSGPQPTQVDLHGHDSTRAWLLEPAAVTSLVRQHSTLLRNEPALFRVPSIHQKQSRRYSRRARKGMVQN